MSLMANAVASSKTFSEGMSPLPILQKMHGACRGLSPVISSHLHLSGF